MRQVLGPGALGRPRGIGWRGRWEGGSGWGTHVNPWLIHFNVWQNPLQYCKVISLQLKKKKKSIYGFSSHTLLSFIINVLSVCFSPYFHCRVWDQVHGLGNKIPHALPHDMAKNLFFKKRLLLFLDLMSPSFHYALRMYFVLQVFCEVTLGEVTWKQDWLVIF